MAANRDFTGFSWNDPRTIKLISPSHVFIIVYFIRFTEVAVMSQGKIGKVCERYITEVQVLASGEIAVVRLNFPLPAGVMWQDGPKSLMRLLVAL